MNLDFYFYYIVIFLSVIAYLVIAKRCSIPLYSFSNAFYAAGLVLSFLPGYFVARGKLDSTVYRVGYQGFDYELYAIYLITAVVVPIGLTLSSYSTGRKYISIRVRKSISLRFIITFIFIVVVIISYFIWIPSIPIFKLITEDFSSAYASRLQITHGYVNLSPPFILKYWRALIQSFPTILFLILFAVEYKNRRVTIKSFLFFIVVFFLLVFTLEKAAIFQFFLIIVTLMKVISLDFDMDWKDKNLLFSIKGFFIVLVLLSLLSIFYYYLMGGHVGDALHRIARQDASNYLQIQYIKSSGYLGLSGLNSIWLNKFGIEPAANTSVQAIIDMFGRDPETGAGAAGGMFATNIFFIVGWWFIPCIFVYVFLLGSLDRILVNSIRHSSALTHSVLVAFYAYIMINLSLAARADFNYIFSFSYILSPQIILLLMLLLIFLKLKLFTIKHT